MHNKKSDSEIECHYCYESDDKIKHCDICNTLFCNKCYNNKEHLKLEDWILLDPKCSLCDKKGCYNCLKVCYNCFNNQEIDNTVTDSDLLPKCNKCFTFNSDICSAHIDVFCDKCKANKNNKCTTCTY